MAALGQEAKIRLVGTFRGCLNAGCLNAVLQMTNIFSFVGRLGRSKGISRSADKKEFKVEEAL